MNYPKTPLENLIYMLGYILVIFVVFRPMALWNKILIKPSAANQPFVSQKITFITFNLFIIFSIFSLVHLNQSIPFPKGHSPYLGRQLSIIFPLFTAFVLCNALIPIFFIKNLMFQTYQLTTKRINGRVNKSKGILFYDGFLPKFLEIMFVQNGYLPLGWHLKNHLNQEEMECLLLRQQRLRAIQLPLKRAFWFLLIAIPFLGLFLCFGQLRFAPSETYFWTANVLLALAMVITNYMLDLALQAWYFKKELLADDYACSIVGKEKIMALFKRLHRLEPLSYKHRWEERIERLKPNI